jgi:aminoglycoside/choline kinase family phosphotransferase
MNPAIIAVLDTLFSKQFGTSPERIDPLPISGSDRRYYRLTGGGNVAIGTINDNVAENNTFFYFTELFKKHGIRVPAVYGCSKDRKAYLQEDLGGRSLFDKLTAEGLTESVRADYRTALEGLARIQWVAGREADFKQCFGTKSFDERAITSDLHYFKYYFADLQKLPYDRALLADEMESLAKELGRMQPQVLMYRDFQSRNILLPEGGGVAFIDYQGAMQGPTQYDLASLLWQAKAALPDSWKDDLLNGYVTNLKDLSVRVEEVHFRRGYIQFVLLRLMQVLGAYGFRGILERKPHFLSSITPALDSLSQFLGSNPGVPAYPEMRSLLERLTSQDIKSRFAIPKPQEDAKLLVDIGSFSYKQGLPPDETGHGGGYVFDCRGILNPGRFEPYKHLSGRDAAVQHFLEGETEMPRFLEHVFSLVSITVEDYLARGFDRLSVSFGCTGGQHRSVYAAEKLSAYLKSRYGLAVQPVHHNEGRWVKLDSGQ